MTIEEAINNLKRGKCIPYKHETLTLVINALESWKLTKAEIGKESEVETLQLHWGEAMGLNKAIDIIDKHIPELRGDTDG